MGLAGLRGVDDFAKKHMIKVNGWIIDELNKHLIEQSMLYRERSAIKRQLDLSIITNSGYKLNEDD